MNRTGEDWLNDEKFDFNLNCSKSSVEEYDVDDEEVFGSDVVTHKEKCVAALVQEREAIKTFESPNAQEQALLLKESALISLKIRSHMHSTPGRRNANFTISPIAVVHPMKRDDLTRKCVSNEENKENIPKIPITEADTECTTEEAKGQQLLSSNTKVKQPEIKMKNPIHSLSKKSKRLSMPGKVSGSITGCVEPFSDDQQLGSPCIVNKSKENVQKNERKNSQSAVSLQRSSFGISSKIKKSNSMKSVPKKPLDTDTGAPSNKTVNTNLQKRLKKPLMIAKPGTISKSKSGGGIPSLPGSATQPKYAAHSSIKPLKPSTQSLSGIPQEKSSTKPVYGIAQSQLKMSSRKCASVGTPTENKKVNVFSAQRQTIGVKKLASISGTPGTEKKIPKQTTRSETKRLITPVVKPPRKSMVGRQLNPATDDEISKNSLSDDIATPNDVEKQETINAIVPEPTEKQIPSTKDILEKYRNYCSSQTWNLTSNDSEVIMEVSTTITTDEKRNGDAQLNGNNECVPQKVDNINAVCTMKNENTASTSLEVPVTSNVNNNNDVCSIKNENIASTCVEVSIPSNVNNDNDVCSIKNENTDSTHVEVSVASNNVNVFAELLPVKFNEEMETKSPAPLLLDLCCMESQNSPVKVNNLDPFQTGNTPPPLIQLDIMLEPERPPEINLIEF